MELFRTDFYQLSMMLAYIVLDMHNDRVGFEGFVRKIDPNVNPDKTHYVFEGNRVESFMQSVKEELASIGRIKDMLCEIVLPKVHPSLRNHYRKLIKQAALNAEFEYRILPSGSVLKPLVPAFQFLGPRWLGQLIETRVCLTMNGATGWATNRKNDGSYDIEKIIYPCRDGVSDFDQYMLNLENRAFAIRNATSAILLEAAYRRAPSDEAANEASRIAIKTGWDGTSNVGAYLDGLVPLDKIGGTMAHSFVMGHRSELEAFENWNFVWPNSTLLIDTYDTANAARLIAEHGIGCAEVRIDSDPLSELSMQVKKTLPHKGLFLSGDLDEEKLAHLHHIPYHKCMVGTKYVNGDRGASSVNAGFVYKLVEVEDHAGVFYPAKKAVGKTNHPGLKKVFVKDGRIIVNKLAREEGLHPLPDLGNIDPSLDVTFEF